MTKPLSPAAQAVLDAFLANWADDPLYQDRLCLAAALRAAADQLTPYSVAEFDGAAMARNRILAIAAEIEIH